MVADHLMDDEVEELLRKIRVKMCIFRKAAQARNLLSLTRGVRRRELVQSLEGSHRLGAAEAFCQHGHKSCVNIVYAAAEVLQGFRGARLICHGDQGLWLLVKNIMGSL
jgi:hypothetical protein